MILVADSSALIALAVCDVLPLLEELFGSVKVPEAVYHEVTVDNKNQSKQLQEFLSDKRVSLSPEEYFVAGMGFGLGEVEAMTLYRKLHADYLLIDDNRARKIAQLNGLNTIGSLGVLLMLKEKKLISEITPFIQKIRESDLFFSDEILSTVLNIAGET